MLLLAPLAVAHVPFERGTFTVTEIHVGAAVEGGQWFEVQNATASTQNLVEQVFTDADGDRFEVAYTLLVSAGGRAVFAAADSPVAADYRVPAAFDLRAEAGEVHHSDLLGTVDRVAWDAAWGVAGAWQASAPLAGNEWANDLARSWCAGAAATDPAAPSAGTPGAANLPCPGSDTDDDGDGVTELDGDCDDADPDVHPGAPDGPDPGDDGDCDGARDDAPPTDTGAGDTGAGDTGPHADTADTATADPDTADTATADPDTADTHAEPAPDAGAPPRADDPPAATTRCGCGGGGLALPALTLFATPLLAARRRPSA